MEIGNQFYAVRHDSGGWYVTVQEIIRRNPDFMGGERPIDNVKGWEYFKTRDAARERLDEFLESIK